MQVGTKISKSSWKQMNCRSNFVAFRDQQSNSVHTKLVKYVVTCQETETPLSGPYSHFWTENEGTSTATALVGGNRPRPVFPLHKELLCWMLMMIDSGTTQQWSVSGPGPGRAQNSILVRTFSRFAFSSGVNYVELQTKVKQKFAKIS